MYGRFAIAAAALAGLASALPTSIPAASTTKLTKRISDSYTYYTGNGDSWPTIDQWGDWNDLWNQNVPLMQQSCGWNGWGDNDSSDEISAIDSAIQQLSGQTGVDARFILAIVMQESKGCVRVITTGNGITNPGLMQSHDGSGTCVGQDPCPDSEITQMITDGTAGTSSGDGLQQTLSETAGQTGAGSAVNYYAAARMYNSGSVDYTNLDNGFSSTPCYASDVANRLTGWALAGSSCTA